MASNFCQEFANAILDYYFGYTSSPYATLYVGLCTAVADDGTVTNEPTLNTNGYVRAHIANNGDTVWGAASSGDITNSVAAITFDACTTAAWYSGNPLTKFFITDQHETTGAGVALLWGDLSSQVTVNVGDQPTFNTSALTISISHGGSS